MTESEELNDYDAYMKSNAWREKARHIRERDGYRCCICGATDTKLDVHHMTYDRFGHEDDDDLITLCHECHSKAKPTWESMKIGLGVRRRFLADVYRYRRSFETCEYLNILMPHDISFGGEHVLTGKENIAKACESVGIEYKHMNQIQDRFNKIHIFDVGAKVGDGTPKWKLKQDGYPATLVDNIEKRQKRQLDDISASSTISDELVCYMHDGNGKWIVVGEEDGLDTEWRIRFMPYIRYENRWWDNG